MCILITPKPSVSEEELPEISGIAFQMDVTVAMLDSREI